MESIGMEHCNEFVPTDYNHERTYKGKEYMISINPYGLYIAVAEKVSEGIWKTVFFDQSSDYMSFYLDLFDDGQLISWLDKRELLGGGTMLVLATEEQDIENFFS